MNKTYKKLAAFVVILTGLAVNLSAQASSGYRLPDYQKLTLDNGLSVYLMEQHEVPLVDVNLVIKAGAVNDGNKAGLNRLTIANMKLGTKQQNKTEIEETLDFIGAKLKTQGGMEMSSLSASFAVKDQEKVLAIIRDMVVSPRFDAKEFDKYRSRYLVQLDQQKESPRSVISSYFKKMVFGDNGYGSAIQGDGNSITSIALNDLKTFHKTWYQPQNAAVIVVGDFNSKTMLTRLKQLFGGWKNTSKSRLSPPNPAKTFAEPNVLLVDKNNAIETTFLIGGKGITRSNPDYVAVSVINTILGGRFTSWLNDELRVNAGLTYGARSRFTSYSQSGSFSISTFTKTSTTIEAIDLALKTYQRLWQVGVDEKTLSSAKAYVKGRLPPKYETSTQLANLMAEMFAYGFDESFINQFEQQVNSLTTKKAKQIIEQYFPKENLQFVLIGKAEDIKDKVKKYGKVSQISIKDVGF